MTVKEKILAAALAASLAGATGAALAVGTYDKPVSLDLTFKTHSEDGIPERDVFIEREAGMAQIYRPAHDERDLRKPLFAPIRPVRHAPLAPHKLGPWPKGRPLDITLGAWRAAGGRATYRCADGKGRLVATFTRLVPEGVYSLWHTFAAWRPTDSARASLELPLGARDGSQSAFRANADGSAMVVRDFEPCLQLSGEHLVSGLAVAWHSDGQTHGAWPGDYGTRTHLQLYLDLPRRGDT